ncbi:MAG: hypothetical protein AABZ06_12360, partial [Bdellovibrionota bacterium]
DRPTEFMLAAIPQRANPRDIAIFCPDIIQRIKSGKQIQIGTSSPRRLENATAFLKQALPWPGNVQLSMAEIRGNVNTRLSRLHETSERRLDGVILAMAGLIRLAADKQAEIELKNLLHNCRIMVLPLPECPAAPAQGALAVECLSKAENTIEALHKLHHAATATAVLKERGLLAECGGGCHQRFGATAFEHQELGALMFVRGMKPDDSFIEELRWKTHMAIKKKSNTAIRPWDGSAWRKNKGEFSVSEAALNAISKNLPGKAVFVAHSRAFPPGFTETTDQCRIWTSGTASWFKLAGQGVWVEGCAENLGFNALMSTISEPVLKLPSFKDWVVLTHEDAVSEWSNTKAFATYNVKTDYPQEALTALKQTTHIFWSSGSQFEALRDTAMKNAIHACGPGKTASRLRSLGVEPLVFPSSEEWRKWLTS